MKLNRMRMAVLIVNFLFSASFVASSELCVDTLERFYITSIPDLVEDRVSCKWAARSNTDQRCSYEEVWNACPQTCGICSITDYEEQEDGESIQYDSTITECEDSTTFFFISGIGAKRQCDWAGRKSTKNRCDDHVEVRANCRATCGLCDAPSASPSASPSKRPTPSPSKAPSPAPTYMPSSKPSPAPVPDPSRGLTSMPSAQPSPAPTASPSESPTPVPSASPSDSPTGCNDFEGKFYVDMSIGYKFCSWAANNVEFRCALSQVPINCPEACGLCNDAPSESPTFTSVPSEEPTRPPSPQPSPFPTLEPSLLPSSTPTDSPTNIPSETPSMRPSLTPSMSPSLLPSTEPSLAPSTFPSDGPSLLPSDEPSILPSDEVSITF